MSPLCDFSLLIFVLTLQGEVRAGKVIGGHEAAPHTRPYMAILVGIAKNDRKYCGGFLLNEDFVMTAAHCQMRRLMTFNVLLGVHNFHDKPEVQNLTADEVFPHKKYNASSLQNDIMLVKLNSKAKFNDYVRPITLADMDPPLPTSCTVSGWGQTSMDRKGMSNVLMEVNVTLIHNKQCEEMNDYCSEGNRGPGEGDSGGPLVCEDGKAYGVVSAGKKRPLPLYKYTKIPNSRKWIDDTMKYL